MNTSRHKTYIMGIALVAVLGVLAGCTSEENLPQQGGMLRAETQVSGSRADGSSVVPSDDAFNENSLAAGLHVFVFDKAGNKKLYRHITDAKDGEQSTLQTGNWLQELTLAAGQTYDVYAIANGPSAEVAACNTVAELKALSTSDADIYKVHTATARKYFLMDQYLEWTPTADSRQVIRLDAMKRAAAKIQLNLNAVVEGYTVGTPLFRMVNYNTSTSILEKGSEGHVSVTGMEHYVGNSNSFNGEDGLYWNQFVAYSYSFSWAGDMEQRPSILVKLPLTKNGESETKYFYYRIPVRPTGETALERNHIYKVTAKVTSLGASSELRADMEADIQYCVLPWIQQEVDVNVPDRKYLMVTPDLVFMRNVATDNSIKFYASSACKVEISEVYYYDKNNAKKVISQGNDQYPAVTLTGTNEGHVDINSTIPKNLTVKYIKLRISLANEPSTYKEVLVKQYPIEYAQAIFGWYSSRNDESWIDYQRDKTAHNTKKTYSDYGGSYRAKIYVPEKYNGTTEISYLIDEGVYSSDYWWESPKENPPYTAKASGTSQNKNPNMYVIQITSTNGDYVIGHPKIDYSNPNSSSYGSKDHVVSPAFMIASQLGAVMSDGFDKRTAITHCKTYREVAKDSTVYDNWRLPTNEEVKVICDYQGTSNSPIDVVLAGRYYRTLSQETVLAKANGNEGYFVRCVRDMTKEEVDKLEESKK